MKPKTPKGLSAREPSTTLRPDFGIHFQVQSTYAQDVVASHVLGAFHGNVRAWFAALDQTR